ncbi:MAG: radical SAM protein, partial [Nitrospinae bacterium CG11_big_fil_rev_8_21_14_0_20_56_8]
MGLRIYLADLTHTGAGIATEAFPLNVGLMASYAHKRFGREIEISLFKYPQDLLEAMRAHPPDILGCSNYTWNANLAYNFTLLAKSLNINALTVWGGTNYPFESSPQEEFLRKRPALDVHVFYEGEQAFGEVVERMLATGTARNALTEPIPGCQFISPSDGSFVSGPSLPRIQDLDSIPSPYVTGWLDKFFDGVLTPLLETARGCPFACNFCNAGDDYYTRVNKFSDDYVREELTYVARKASRAGVGHATLADNNFGMIPRDAKTVRVIHDLQTQYHWPASLTVWTGKNSRQRVIEATRLLGSSLSISMSVQSLDNEVLKNIKRDNIRLEDFRAIADELSNQERPQHSEVIMPLPGE